MVQPGKLRRNKNAHIKQNFQYSFFGRGSLFKYTNKYETTPSVYKGSICAQYNADGTIEDIVGSLSLSLSVSVNSGVMTVTVRYDIMYPITDCRCCLIPGDPFA